MENQQQEMPTSVLPDAGELMRRLVEVDPQPHFVEQLYPLFTRNAGLEVNGFGVADMITRHLAEYTENLPSVMAVVMNIRAWEFVSAFTDDEKVRADALFLLSVNGLPTGAED